MIYVDPLIAHNFHGHVYWCHLLGDTEEELHVFAAKLGLKREWCQHPGQRNCHYDITATKRKLAVGYGASENYKEYFLKRRPSE
jgi:hypothetical protein